MFQVRPVDKGRVRQRLMWHCKARRKVCEYKQWVQAAPQQGRCVPQGVI